MLKEHFYKATIEWTGNIGEGTRDYKSYERSYHISIENKPMIEGSSDPSFKGDITKYNPEELLLASLSGCHMLWFLHLCSDNGVVVTKYVDNPTGTMIETENGSGKFEEVILHPEVTVTEESMINKIDSLHDRAYELCFIANSVNFPVKHDSIVNYKQELDL